MNMKPPSHTVSIIPTDDSTIKRIILKNNELTVELTTIGASIVAIHTPDKNGVIKNIVAGFKELSQYNINRDYLGCIVGRYANRIANGRFTLNDQPYQLTINDGVNHLHGGVEGFHLKHWVIENYSANEDACSVIFSCSSLDGEEGYPGNMQISVHYKLSGNQVVLHYTATTDKSGPVNLTNHSYFNLSGFDQASITDHTLQINANYYTEKSALNTPTGEILPVADTDLDFRTPKAIGKGINGFPADLGYDHNFVLQSKKEIIKAAVLKDPDSRRVVSVYTNKPGIQLYTANFWDGTTIGTQHTAYGKHGAVVLETQLFPDSVNHPHFPDSILKPDEVYDYTTIFQFDIDKSAL